MKNIKKIALYAACLMLAVTGRFTAGHAQLIVEQGVHIVVKDNPKIVLHNMRLQHDGSTAPGESEFIVRGDGTMPQSALAGSNSILMYDLQVDHTNGTQLENNIQLENQIRFVQGQLNLNNQMIDLGISGFVMGENELYRITGITGGEISRFVLLNAPTNENPGTLGFMLNGGGNFGNVTIKRGHKPFANVLGAQPGINRYYDVTTSNNGGNTTVRFHYFDAENTAFYPEADLTILRSTDGGTTWVNVGKASQDVNADWIEQTGLDPNGLWTLGDCGLAAPKLVCPADIVVNCVKDPPLNLAGFIAAGGDTSDNCVQLDQASFMHVGDVVLEQTCTHGYVLTRSYSIRSKRGLSGSCTQQITVQDTVAPSLSLTGGATVRVCAGDAWVDPGYAASDNCAGDLSSAVVISGSVNTQTSGTYFLNYNVQDACGNTATQLRRRVIVEQSPIVSVLPAVTCYGSYVDIASLLRDYSMASRTFVFYDALPDAPNASQVASIPAFRGTARRGQKLQIRITQDTCFWVVGLGARGAQGCTDTAKIFVQMRNCGLPLTAKVYLEGAYDQGTGLMRDGLRTQQLIPLTEPYTGLGFSFVQGGGEQTNSEALTITGSDAIVDWVRVELRDSSNPQQVAQSRAALLQRDGDIVEVDGMSTVIFDQASTGNYYVVVSHRNHLGVMSGQWMRLDSTGGTIDLSNPSVAIYGSIFARKSINNTAVMLSGDADGNGQVQNTDHILHWIQQAGTAGYRTSDYNLDGQVQNSDMVHLWLPNAGRGSFVP